MDYLYRLKLLASVVAVGVSLLCLVRLRRKGELYGWREVVFGLWFIVALAIQLIAQSAAMWIAGLVAQAALAAGLLIKEQFDDIY